MKTSDPLSLAFGRHFEHQLAQFAVDQNLLEQPDLINSHRFLARSIVPHVQKLSALFNREGLDPGSPLIPYWKESTNPKNLKLAYFLYFMPAHLYRVAAIWTELARLGFRWNTPEFRGVEFGAGPASGACGIAAAEHYTPLGLPSDGNWALIEQDQALLRLGASWLESYAHSFPPQLSQLPRQWSVRQFHRTIDLKQGLLPRKAPAFHLWIMSYYLNELPYEPAELAVTLMDAWDRHLEEEGLILIVEPALRLQSRRLLTLRRELLRIQEQKQIQSFQILTPCLGHQACGALAQAEDWCHEEVTWWRPSYFKIIDQLASLDRKTLPMSYLVLTKSKKSREEILPALLGSTPSKRHRLVSPAHSEGKDFEFFMCGETGKQRARYRPAKEGGSEAELERGDILLDAEVRGNPHSAKVTSIRKKL